MKDSDWEILYELHKNPNMTRVANLLYMTQPSLTKRLQGMEAELQITILDRTPKGLCFTPAGEYLAERAKEHIAFCQETNKGLKHFREKPADIITIGSSYTYSKYYLPEVLSKYRQKNPGTEFDIHSEQSNVLFRKVVEESVDVAFIHGNYEGAVEQILIGTGQAYLVTDKPVKMEDIPYMPRIMYTTNDRTLESLEEWWQDQFGTKSPAGMAVGYIDVAWRLIHKGMGYTLCFWPDDFSNEYGLCLTPLIKRDGTPIVRNTWFIYKKSKRRPEVLEHFVRYIEKELKV
ncbi:MAG: LysR family transcriptional regulator [Lachnospiraceae bacterium]|nr:LysR family transcriptional regulator [Lachnospiraceae bacterium]